MISMFIVGGVLALAFGSALVVAALADRRRSLAVVADASRFAPQAVGARLPWL
ncbi:MAG: hypothetical protein ACJ72D_22525 [Marmoricola sp.]